MATEKYICRCGKQVNKITSYFKEGIRFTMCNECAEAHGFNSDSKVEKVDYDVVMKSARDENYYRMIDTTEKDI